MSDIPQAARAAFENHFRFEELSAEQREVADAQHWQAWLSAWDARAQYDRPTHPVLEHAVQAAACAVWHACVEQSVTDQDYLRAKDVNFHAIAEDVLRQAVPEPIESEVERLQNVIHLARQRWQGQFTYSADEVLRRHLQFGDPADSGKLRAWLFKVSDYTNVLLGQRDNEGFFVQRGDGTKYHYEDYRVEWARPYTTAMRLDPLVLFEDADVQRVYEVLCSEDAPPKGEHWEGFTARRIVEVLRAARDQREEVAQVAPLTPEEFLRMERQSREHSESLPQLVELLNKRMKASAPVEPKADQATDDNIRAQFEAWANWNKLDERQQLLMTSSWEMWQRGARAIRETLEKELAALRKAVLTQATENTERGMELNIVAHYCEQFMDDATVQKLQRDMTEHPGVYKTFMAVSLLVQKLTGQIIEMQRLGDPRMLKAEVDSANALFGDMVARVHELEDQLRQGAEAAVCEPVDQVVLEAELQALLRKVRTLTSEQAATVAALVTNFLKVRAWLPKALAVRDFLVTDDMVDALREELLVVCETGVDGQGNEELVWDLTRVDQAIEAMLQNAPMPLRMVRDVPGEAHDGV